MKLKSAWLVLMLSLGLVACVKKWDGDPQLVNKLALDMSEEEVKRILGEPSGENKLEVMGIVTKTWIYNGKQQIGLVVQDGKLVSAQLDGKIILGDSH